MSRSAEQPVLARYAADDVIAAQAVHDVPLGPVMSSFKARMVFQTDSRLPQLNIPESRGHLAPPT